MSWFLLALQKYATFSGRSRRKEYWFFLLFYVIIVFGLSVIDGLIGTYSEKAEVGLLSGLFVLSVLIPSLAVTIRRLHDTNRTGWWVLIGLIPLVGAIVLLVFCVQDSNAGANDYGENPKAAADV